MAAIAAGAINIAWGDFATDWQPITAFTTNGYFPFRHPFAYVTALLLLMGGAALLNRRTARLGALLLTVVYSVFAIMWLPRLYWVPHFFGFRVDMLAGALAGLGQQVILVCAAIIVLGKSNKAAQIARIAFALSVIAFGIAHLVSPFSAVAALVPKWLPPGQVFWADFTGVAFALAGIAILSGVLSVLAASLLTVMLAIFSALVLAPQIPLAPHDQSAWAGNAYNLAAIGAAWILAGYLARQSRPG